MEDKSANLKPVYEVVVLGTPTKEQVQCLHDRVTELTQDFELELGADIAFRTSDEFHARRIEVACVAVYFGGDPAQDADMITDLIRSGVPMVPVVLEGQSFNDSIPATLQGANGMVIRQDDAQLLELATALLECLGLLRVQRRVFVSYRRLESRATAVQLHDCLSERGFDVFLDTHAIRPGEPFQDVLWHRLCDSDVLIMLDTPEYFDSIWTRAELAKAQAKEIHVLRIVWPDHSPQRKSDVGETIFLDPPELKGPDGPLVDDTIDQISLALEDLRSRSIAARYLSISGKLRAEADKIGATIDSIGSHRSIGITLDTGRRLWAYPVVGIPTAALLNEVVEKASAARQAGTPILVYDDIGIGKKWANHIAWLNEQIASVKTIRITHAAWELVDLEG